MHVVCRKICYLSGNCTSHRFIYIFFFRTNFHAFHANHQKLHLWPDYEQIIFYKFLLFGLCLSNYYFWTKRPFKTTRISLIFLSHFRFSLIPVSFHHFCVCFLRPRIFFIFHKYLDFLLLSLFLTLSFILHILVRSCLVSLGPFLPRRILVFWLLFTFLGNLLFFNFKNSLNNILMRTIHLETYYDKNNSFLYVNTNRYDFLDLESRKKKNIYRKSL